MKPIILLVTTLLALLAACAPLPVTEGRDEGPTAGQTFRDFYPGDPSAVTRIVMRHGAGARRAVEAPAEIAVFFEMADSLVFTPQADQTPRGGYLYLVDLYAADEKTLTMTFSGDRSAFVNGVYYDLNVDIQDALDGLFNRAGELVSYHPLTFELTTTAEAARVTFIEPYYLLTVRYAGVIGQPLKGNGNLDSLWVRQEAAGGSAGVLMEYAVTWVGEVAPPVRCEYEQNGAGASVLRVYDSVSRDERILAEVALDGVTDCALDLSLLNGTPFLEQTLPVRVPHMTWAYYYPWYVRDAWDTGILLDAPALGYYGSDDLAIIEQHVQQAQTAGIDGFISSWWGPRDYTDSNLRLLLEVAEERNFSVMINFEMLKGEEEPLSESEILDWLRYAVSQYGQHPAYAKIDGKPVFVIWVSFLVPDSTWERILSALRAEGLEPFLIGQFAGEWTDPAALEVFGGLYQYNILNVMPSAEAEQVETLRRVYATIGRNLRYHSLLGSSATRVWAATVQPGYDDHLIPGRTTPILPRDDGRLYRATFEAALASDPDWIFITSWNEWWEHTYIEPGNLFGDLYLQITREYTETR